MVELGGGDIETCGGTAVLEITAGGQGGDGHEASGVAVCCEALVKNVDDGFGGDFLRGDCPAHTTSRSMCARNTLCPAKANEAAASRRVDATRPIRTGLGGFVKRNACGI